MSRDAPCPDRPDFFSAPDARQRLHLLERINVALVRWTFTSRWIDAILRRCQRSIGAGWIHACTKNLRHEVGLERLPHLAQAKSFILVTNHRSFFDMFVVAAVLYRAGMRQRLLFPVRSTFFYDTVLGFIVNGAMSFWSMYPPIFRDRKRAVLNHTAMSELIWCLKRGGRSAGIHPEGARKKDGDPYIFLPAQSGAGRAIHQSRAEVIPAFINGLSNDIVKQIAGNFTGRGRKVVVVFGSPIDFGTLLDEPPNARVFKQVADKTLEAIGELAKEEQRVRAQLNLQRASAGAGASTG